MAPCSIKRWKKACGRRIGSPNSPWSSACWEFNSVRTKRRPPMVREVWRREGKMRKGGRRSRIEKQAHLLMFAERERRQICVQRIRSDEGIDHIDGDLAFGLQDFG